jgi:hypothetical protein
MVQVQNTVAETWQITNLTLEFQPERRFSYTAGFDKFQDLGCRFSKLHSHLLGNRSVDRRLSVSATPIHVS